MITFRPYQRHCIDAFYGYYDSGKTGHGLIVVPTAGGKSLIIGGLATEICKKWPGQRIIILSHVRELIQQNYEKVKLCWKDAQAGIYSAGLKKRQAYNDIVVASVQSVFDKAHEIGHRDLCFIDEAHLLQFANMGMYGKLLTALLEINPAMKICGFTATDYRLDGGRLTEGNGKLFDDVIIDIPIKYLLDEGYLTTPIGKSQVAQANLEGVKRTGGEFNIKQMAERFNVEQFINAALDEDIPYLEDRNSIAVFCATLENANHVCDGMIKRGFPCEVIDGQMRADIRENKLQRFRSGELRALASVGVMTTGTDIPNMDAVVLFRATESPGLYQQIIGRGFRVMYADGFDLTTAEGRLAAIAAGPKPNFITLDHGGNIKRHGSIINIEKPKKREKGERRDPTPKAKIRICEKCRTAWLLDVKICGECKTVMVTERDSLANLTIQASEENVLGDLFLQGERAEWFAVDDVKYSKHEKAGGATSLKVTYYCGIMQFNEWVRIDLLRGKKWWDARALRPALGPAPVNIDRAVDWAQYLEKPVKVQIIKKNQFYEVIRHEFNVAAREARAASVN